MSFTFDFNALREEIIQATIHAYNEISHELADDTIGGICLLTDDGAMTVSPAFASKSYLEHYASTMFHYTEWPITQGADREFNAACGRLAGYVLGSTETIDTVRSQVLATLTCAAEELRQRLELDESVIVLVGLKEGSSEDLRAAERTKRLNSPEIYQLYVDELGLEKEE